jgi:hypothetical protein
MVLRQRLKRLSLWFTWLSLRFILFIVMGMPLLLAIIILVGCIKLLYDPSEWVTDKLEELDQEELNALKALGAKNLE